MDFETLFFIIASELLILSMFLLRGLLDSVKAVCCILVLSCTFLGQATNEPCSEKGIQTTEEFDSCGSFGKSYDVGLSGTIISNARVVSGTSKTQHGPENVCARSQSFCFPSALSGFSYGEKQLGEAAFQDSNCQNYGPLHVEPVHDSKFDTNSSWSSDYGTFKLFKGGVVSCSLNSKEGTNDLSSLHTDGPNEHDLSSCRDPLLKQKAKKFCPKNSEVTESGSYDGSSLPNVIISPTVLDWGERDLYFPTMAYLTMVNTYNDSVLHVHEPFSTDLQFYPCNSSETLLEPGESFSFCFIFLPRWLGLSSAHLIIQTSLGGFIIQAKGYGIASPYRIGPFIHLEVSPGRTLSKNFSVFNPFDETLYVEKVSAWVSVSLEHNFHLTEASCTINNVNVSDDLFFSSIKDHLIVKSAQVGAPMMAIRPYRSWEIGPLSSETVIEIDISVGYEGKIFGAFCLQLLRHSVENSDTIVVPLEAQVGRNAVYEDPSGFISASLEGLANHNSSGAVAISLRNNVPRLISFDKVVEVSGNKGFDIKCVEGLLLFPNAVTPVAIITCSDLHAELHDSKLEMANRYKNCKLFILTNDSSSAQIEIPCMDIIYICSKYRNFSSFGYEHKAKDVDLGNKMAGLLGDSLQLPLQTKEPVKAELNELMLGNWKSQDTTGGMSVLDEDEVLFPMIQVGSHISKWITVTNPSKDPVVMQLILNSGEIVDECKGSNGLIRNPSWSLVSFESSSPARYGFSIAEDAVTEAYVHPNGRVSLGPVLFYPSNRCAWRSSALIRNNLSGVEWLSLRGSGGLLSLVLLEGSEPVERVEFKPLVPSSLNFSLLHALVHMKETVSACLQPILKDLFAKNSGDIPLEVLRIEVSEMECGGDGFVVHSCGGFTLEPGESIKFTVSYQTDFSAAVFHRDLKLILTTGFLVIPMKASFPLCMYSNCKKSMCWMRARKYFVALLLVASLMFLIACCIYPQTIKWDYSFYLCKTEKHSPFTAAKGARRTPHRHHNQRRSKISTSPKMHNMYSFEDKTLALQASAHEYSYGEGRASENGISQHVRTAPGDHIQDDLLDTEKGTASPSLTVKASHSLELLQQGNLTVRTGNVKVRRRRKRKGPTAKLMGFVEVSSSQSGNSTPSSPLSPVTLMTPRHNRSLSLNMEHAIEVQNSFAQVANQLFEKGGTSFPDSKTNKLDPKVSQNYCNDNLFIPSQGQHLAPRKPTDKCKLMPSATLHLDPILDVISSSPLSVSQPKIACDARAPGSELYKQKTAGAEEKGVVEDEYTYDIWGEHFSGLHLLGASKNVSSMISITRENNSDSFFIGGPQTLVTNSRPRSVRCFHQEG